MFSSARPLVQSPTIKLSPELQRQQWREWAIERAARCYRGDDPRALIAMADAIMAYAQGTEGGKNE